MKKSMIAFCLFNVLYISSLFLQAMTYDIDFVTTLKEYEQNIVDYANGDDWMSATNVELGDAGAYDPDYIEPEQVDFVLEPLGSVDSSDFSYYMDIESDSYFQVYETDTNIYIVQWKYNDLTKPSLIDSFSK